MKEDYFNILIKDIIENNDKEKAIETIANKLNEKQLSSEKEILASIKKDQEIERLNKLISQREKKWEKWTTEKTILSTKMSDYLCKYQNLKREYTKQIKISTDRKKEIERLNNIINELEKWLEERIEKHTEDYLDWKYDRNVYLAVDEELQDVFDKLQELKGSNDNG